MPQRFNPRPTTANEDPRIGPNRQPGCSLVEGLGETVDGLRQFYTDFGLRPYRVFSVVVRWSGGESGRGDASVESEVELLPTPLVHDMKQLRGVSKSAGRDEEGGVKLTQISPRYTEDDIRTIFHTQPLPGDRDGFLEIRVDERDGKTQRRRFSVKGTPFRDTEKFEWSVRLRAQTIATARTRDGAIRDDVLSPGEVQVLRFSEGE